MKALLSRLRATVYSAVFSCTLVSLGLLTNEGASAQSIRADSILTSPGAVTTTDNENFSITGGTQLGSSLFHGFEAFSIPTNGSAVFNNSTNVTNIFSRVTGEQASAIDGLLSVKGSNTNLFFLNPNGITFGSSAQLQIGGSFLASTAESIQFTNDVEFAASPTTLNPLLSISTPIGLQLNADSGSIEVTDSGYTPLPGVVFPNITLDSSSSLRANVGQTFALVGNEINFDGGVVAAPGGHIELGSVRDGFVKFDSSNWRFNYEEVEAFSDMDFSARSLIDTSNLLFDGTGTPYAFGLQGGSIGLRGNNLTFKEASRALIQNYSELASGDIQAIASDTLELRGEFSTGERGSSLATMNFGGGDGGDINVTSPRLLLIGDTSVGTDTFTTGTGGNVTIDASETIRFESNQAAVPDFGQINTNSFGTSAAGTLLVSTGDLVILGDGISSQAGGLGPGGLVKVNAENVTLESGANIAASTLFFGEGGDVEVTADTINLRGINPRTFLPSTITAPTTGAGDAGNVTVSARQISLSEGARIDSSALSTGSSGVVKVTASESLTVDGTLPGTDIPSLIISSANIASQGIRDFFVTIGVILPPAPSGDSGSVIIKAPNLTVTNGAQVTVRNDGTGDAGTLTADAAFVYLSDRAAITASTQQGNGGNIKIKARDGLLLRRGSRLSAEARSTGNGGNVTLSAPTIIALENSDITASAIQGDGGNVQINAGAILGTAFREQLTPESDITASSEFGASGEVKINALESDPSTGITALSETLSDSSDQIVAGCSDTSGNQFAATGRGGLPASPLHQFANNRPWMDLRDTEHLELEEGGIVEAKAFSGEALVEAVNFVVEENGEMALVAPNDNARSTAVSIANCIQ